ncbi:hypothetical protein ACWGKW_00875 [Streptomyces sp. NPDC054766]|uniref:hypothetical protein n=1 Tax=Streptomyces rhizosphaerihabitans TaxID=1266770 RepID=UPI0021C1E532|nr:hypothetical protein [Streptomyces rhizosphaerihabitans]MCT9005949.1 hypothetical protein [Streptomyces rhizosphaerihabitans]
MKILVIVAVCVVGYLFAGQCAWVLYGWIKDGKALWLTPWGLREAVEDRMPTDASGLPLALMLWVFMSVAWPFPLAMTVSEDLRERRERRERLEQRKREARQLWRSRSRPPSAAPVEARPDAPDD